MRSEPATALPEPTPDHACASPRLVGCVIGDSAAAPFGLSTAERLRRSLVRAGIAALVSADDLPKRGAVLLLSADHVLDEVIVKRLVANPDVVLVSGGGKAGQVRLVAAHLDAVTARRAAPLLRRGPMSRDDPQLAGMALVSPADLDARYEGGLRKRGAPLLIAATGMTEEALEKAIFAGAYKGVTDFVTKWVWPLPARKVTAWAARRGITPNLVTLLSLLLVFVALGLFAAGLFLTGLLVAWLMTFLDTVDGKLARVTLSSTPGGNVFDHGIDLVHPPFWYAAWWYGLQSWGPSAPGVAELDLALWVVVLGYIAGRLEEGLFLWRFGIEIHTWRPVDSTFRLFTARRNPNLVLLTAGTVLGRPDLGFVAIAVWTAASCLFHAVRIAQAGIEHGTGRPIRSWLSEAAAESQ